MGRGTDKRWNDETTSKYQTYRKEVSTMAFDPHLTVEHGLAVSHDIDNVLDKAELDPTTSETIKKVAGHVRYYADLEVENILSDIEDLRSEVASIPIIDDLKTGCVI